MITRIDESTGLMRQHFNLQASNQSSDEGHDTENEEAPPHSASVRARITTSVKPRSQASNNLAVRFTLTL